jgi:SAM-dependent methyltransferase
MTVNSQKPRQLIIAALRKTRLFLMADEIKFWLNATGNYRRNRAFAASRPTESFPPPRISYDAYATVSYEHYWTSGKQSAETLFSFLKANLDLSTAKILEWGCGPGRIIGPLERLVRNYGTKVFGCDYNPASIHWCSSAIPGVGFRLNELLPPLPFEGSFFDAVYSCSVFTHLSEEMHYAWLKENLRVLKNGGLLFFTTHGDRVKYKLLPAELLQYERGEVVVRASNKEGKRSFASFQSPLFVTDRLLASVQGIELIRHETQAPFAGLQDLWIVRKL